jgi:ABC-type glycerol-3-phosphate transport system permease component
VKRTRGEKIFGVFNNFFLLLIALTMAVPMLTVLKDSFDNFPVDVIGISLIPREPTLLYYRMAFTDVGIYRPLLNTIYITVIGTMIALAVNAMGAYTLRRKKRVKGTQLIVYIFIIAPMVLGGGGIIASYIWFRLVGFLDSLILAVVLPITANGFHMIVIRQFYWTVPESLIESAEMDGASEFLIFRKIVAPMSKAVYAAMGLFTGVGLWNQWRNVLFFVNNPQKYTFPLKLRSLFFYQQDPEEQMKKIAEAMGLDITEVLLQFEGLRSAMIMIGIIPVLLIYPYLQRHFAKGVRLGAIKG